MRVGPQPAADPQVEADLPVVASHADERDVVDLVLGALLRAPRDRGLELARKIAERRIADEALVRLLEERRRVDDLVGIDAGKRTPDHVARRVAACLRRRQPDSLDRLEDPRHVFDADPVQLDVLPVGDVGNVTAEALCDVCDRAQLLGLQ